MSSSNNRTINEYEIIDGELVLSEITNQVLATDSDGLVYGINNYISNLTSDVQSQINTINTTLANKEDLLTAANKLDMVYVGSGNVSSDELDMNIGNTTFNIYNTFLSVTGSIDSLTQNKQNLLSSLKLPLIYSVTRKFIISSMPPGLIEIFPVKSIIIKIIFDYNI